jgi:hypothetical protein
MTGSGKAGFDAGIAAKAAAARISSGPVTFPALGKAQ